MKELAGELTKILEEITSLLNQYLPLEAEKLKAIQENKVGFVEDSMKKEQALILKMRGLDGKREELLKKAGCTGKTMREILEELEENEKRQVQPVFDRLVLAVQNFDSYNAESMKLIQLRLHDMEKAAAESQGKTYGKGKESDPDSEHFLSRLL